MTDREFLVAWDYGSGALWQVVFAESAEKIALQFPELDVIEEFQRPGWMTHEKYVELRDRRLDLAEHLGDTPKNLLLTVLRQREADLSKFGSDRPVYTVGYDNGNGMEWSWLRAQTEQQITESFPRMHIRHGRDDEWEREQKSLGRFHEVVHDINNLNDKFLISAL